jgi:hypothetical protein
MSLTNTANKINELCGKIKKLEISGSYIYLDVIENQIIKAQLNINDFNDISGELVPITRNIPIAPDPLTYVDHIKKNIGLVDNKDIIIQEGGVYNAHINSFGALDGENEFQMIITVNDIVVDISLVIAAAPLSYDIVTKSGDVVNFYAFSDSGDVYEGIRYTITLSKL